MAWRNRYFTLVAGVFAGFLGNAEASFRDGVDVIISPNPVGMTHSLVRGCLWKYNITIKERAGIPVTFIGARMRWFDRKHNLINASLGGCHDWFADAFVTDRLPAYGTLTQKLGEVFVETQPLAWQTATTEWIFYGIDDRGDFVLVSAVLTFGGSRTTYCRDDYDEDGADDIADTCPGVADPLQDDRDGDGWGDVCDDPSDGDADLDGLVDEWEMRYWGSTDAVSGKTEDFDGDGLFELEEYTLKSNPTLTDTNSDGLDDAFEVLSCEDPAEGVVIDPPDEDIYYLALGDSVPTGHSIASFNSGLPPATDGYPRILERFLRDRVTENVIMRNAAMWGWTAREIPLFQMILMCIPEIGVLRCPDIVTLTVGANDIHFSQLEEWLPLTPSKRRKRAEERSLAVKPDIEAIIDGIREESPTTEIFVTNYFNPSDKAKCRRMYNLGEDILWAKKRIGLNDVIAAVAREKGVHLIDLYSQFRNHGIESKKGSWLYGTECRKRKVPIGTFDPHPKFSGQQCIAHLIWERMSSGFGINEPWTDPCPDL
ncbi:MAG: hypothetical protein HY460_01060 [Parcubacteria group bacterium]|nr:hypothetical protein [Parcubacteria group bacterium]